MGNQAGYGEFLAELMKQEYDARQEGARKKAIKAAKFPYIKTFDELDLSRIENVEDAYLKELATCEFVKERSNIVLIGNPGTGKTHLSVALGINACNKGMKVKFFTAAKDLPIEIHEYELPESEMTCPQCSHSLKKIGSQFVRDIIKYIPAQIAIERLMQNAYECPCCKLVS